MRKLVIPFLLAAAPLASPANAEFIGTLAFTPQGCESTGLCNILNDFRYIDPSHIQWMTKKGDKTDGASIPPWAQPFIGVPFDKEFIKAAVIHDHYCDRHVRPWRQTHLVFYNALLESEVGIAKAKLMYYAVYVGGPKWIEIIQGRDCGKNCTEMFPQPGNMIQMNEKPRADFDAFDVPPLKLQVRPAQYDKPRFEDDLKDVEKLLKERGDLISLSELEARAQAKAPGDYYYAHGDRVFENADALGITK